MVSQLGGVSCVLDLKNKYIVSNKSGRVHTFDSGTNEEKSKAETVFKLLVQPVGSCDDAPK